MNDSGPPEGDARLIRVCPDLFLVAPWVPDRSCMSYCFAVGESWRRVVLDLLDELRRVVAEGDLRSVRVTQVKET